jgi:hypothetical protein
MNPKLAFSALFALFLFAAHAAEAQQPTRIRGTIAALAGETLSVKTAEGGEVAVRLVEQTEVVFTQPIPLEEIRPGDFLGVTSLRRPDGTLVAFEVRRFPKPLNPGHRPFDGRDDRTMTNATVAAAVESARGRELHLTYEGGSQRIVVAPDAFVATLVPGKRSQLVAGAPVSLTAAPGEGGALVARRIQVGPAPR